MKKLLAVTTITLSLFSLSAQAGEFRDLREKISLVRTSMIELLMNKDMRNDANWKSADAKSATARGALSSLKAPAGKEKAFQELRALGNTFLDTRDKELRTALVAGNDAEAKRLLTVVQKERFGKITALTEDLDK